MVSLLRSTAKGEQQSPCRPRRSSATPSLVGMRVQHWLGWEERAIVQTIMSPSVPAGRSTATTSPSMRPSATPSTIRPTSPTARPSPSQRQPAPATPSPVGRAAMSRSRPVPSRCRTARSPSPRPGRSIPTRSPGSARASPRAPIRSPSSIRCQPPPP